jgi:hypothetical protein
MIVAPDYSLIVIDKEGRQVQELNEFFVGVEKLDVLSGTGSPEGVVEATQRRLYMDDSGTAGSILYIKRDADIAGDKTKGWILV